MKLLSILSVLNFGRGPRRPFGGRETGANPNAPERAATNWQRRGGDVRRSQIERRITPPALRKARCFVARP
jgi:hypothetical protein